MKNRRWETLYNLLKNRDHRIGVEIGSFKGATSKYLLSYLKNLETLICVDPWIKYPDFEKVIYNKKLQKADFDKDVYQVFLNNIEEYKNKVNICRMFSSEAVKYIENNSLDFIFIDGNHSYEYVKEDIELWYPKIKKGGLISGHDYGQDPKKYPGFGVDKAVHEIFGINFSVENKIWYLYKENKNE